MDYWLGFGIGIHRGGNHCEHKLEPVFQRLSATHRNFSASRTLRMPLGRRNNKPARCGNSDSDEHIPHTRNRRQFDSQHNNRGAENIRYIDIRNPWLEIRKH